MGGLILFLISALPVFLIGLYIYNKDKDKEPAKLLIKLFIGGIASCFAVLLLSIVLEGIAPFFAKESSELNLFELFMYIFIKIALIEEVCKWFFTRIISYNDKHFDEMYDMIIYAVFVSLGFAFFENILYVYQGGITVGILRALSAVPGHASFGIYMGYFLGMAKKHNSRKYVFLSVLIPVLLHGIYDFLVLSGNGFCLLIFIPFIIGLFIYSFNKIKNVSSIESSVAYKYKFCPMCGTKVENKYCPKCGGKNI